MSPVQVPATKVTAMPFKARISRFFSTLPRWSYQAAGAAALLVVGILIGRVVLQPPGQTMIVQDTGKGPGLVPASDEATLRAYDYLERSKVLLLGLVNYDAETEGLTFAELIYTINNLYEVFPEAKVMLEVICEGSSEDEIELATITPLEVGRVGFKFVGNPL